VAGAEPTRERSADFDAGAPSDTAEIDSSPEVDPEEAGLRAEIWQRAGKVLVVLGLFVALLSRGCDHAASRSVARLQAKAQLAAVEMPRASESSGGASSQPGTRDAAALATAQQLTLVARRAELSNQAWAFWRSLAMLVGAVLLATGLMPLAWAGRGADRWLGIALLAVLAFSVFSQRAP
jgi:hypothetical protein